MSLSWYVLEIVIQWTKACCGVDNSHLTLGRSGDAQDQQGRGELVKQLVVHPQHAADDTVGPQKVRDDSQALLVIMLPA